MKITKRVSAGVLSALITLGCLPLQAFANDNNGLSSEAEKETTPSALYNEIPKELPNSGRTEFYGVEIPSTEISQENTLFSAGISKRNSDVSTASSYIADENLKEAYQRIYNACLNVHENCTEAVGRYGSYSFAAQVNLSELGIDGEDAKTLMLMTSDFNPEFYWMSNNYLYTTNSDGTINSLVVIFDESFVDSSVRKSYNTLIAEKIQEYAEAASEYDTDYEKVKAVHDKMIDEVTYAYDQDGDAVQDKWAHSVIGVFDESYSRAVCEGYSLAFTMVLDNLGIDAMTVKGNSYSGEYGDHAWNLVQLDDGLYYWFDVTWDDSLSSYDFFACPDEVFGYTHFYGDHILAGDTAYSIEVPEISQEAFDKTILTKSSSNTSTITQGNMTFTADSKNSTCVLTSCTDSGSVIIPESVEGFTVIEIAQGAFSYNYDVTSVTIPKTVKTIRADAFKFCTSLKSVSIEGADRIEKNAFSGCVMLSTVSFCEGLEAICDEAFLNCSSLCEITLPSTVSFVGNRCFEGTSLEKISMTSQSANYSYSCDNGILYSGFKNVLVSFPNCYDADEYTLEDNVFIIGSSSFCSNSSLKTVDTNNALLIGDYAFDGSDIFYAIIGEATQEMGEYAFFECPNLRAVKIFDTLSVIKNKALGFYYDRESLSEIVKENLTVFCNSDNAIYDYCYANGIDTDSYENFEIGSYTNHSFTSTVIEPTYSSQGYTLHTCSECGYSYKDSYTEKLVLDDVSGLAMVQNTASAIKMTWNKVDGATGYVVYQAIDGKWQRIKVTSGNSLTVSNLKAGTNYRFTVKAYKTVDGTNYYCNSYTGVWMTTLPAKPVAKMTVNTAQAIRIEWDKVTGATGYVVYKQVNGKWQKVAVTKNNVYVFTGLSSGTNYNFAVRAYKTFNGKNYYSTFSTSTDTVKACTKPATVNFTLTSGTKKATVSWSKVTGATGYIVYYKTSASGSWQRLTVTTGTSFTKSGLTSGKTYYFTVKAYKTYNGTTYNGSFTTKSVTVK